MWRGEGEGVDTLPNTPLGLQLHLPCMPVGDAGGVVDAFLYTPGPSKVLGPLFWTSKSARHLETFTKISTSSFGMEKETFYKIFLLKKIYKIPRLGP